MKKFYFIIAIFASSFTAYGMDKGMQLKEVPRNKYSFSSIHNVRVAASCLTLVGGWGFFVVNSPRFMNHLSYSVKRMPLAVFLTGCSINQAFIISENIRNKNE